MCTSELKIFVSGGSVSEAIADHTIMNNTRGFWYPNDLAIDYVTPFLLDALFTVNGCYRYLVIQCNS